MTSEEKKFYGLTLQIDMEYCDNELNMYVTDMLDGATLLARKDIDKCVDKTSYKPLNKYLMEKQSKSLKTQMKEHLKKAFSQIKADSLVCQDIFFLLAEIFSWCSSVR